MGITRIALEQFTVFERLDFAPTPGINVLLGANGTGKTHLMKVAYAACDLSKTREQFCDKLVKVFLPSRGAPGRLVKRSSGSSYAQILVERDDALRLEAKFSNHIQVPTHPKVQIDIAEGWFSAPVESVFIPVKEMLANAPGFRSLYARREIHFESIYADVIDRAYLPVLRGPRDSTRARLLKALQKSMEGKVIIKGEEFFLKNQSGELEFTLLAEGLRKLGLLWLLIQNGTLASGSVLFWDEPEANLSPGLFSSIISILLELQRIGVQIFISTHHYAVLKELELSAKPHDQISYHLLHRPEGGAGVEMHTAAQPFALPSHPIIEAMSNLYDREIHRSLGGT